MSDAQSIISSSGYGNVTPHTYNGAIANVIPGTGVGLSLPSQDAVFKIDLPAGTNWTGYTHLQFEVQNTGTTYQPLFVAVASTGIWCFTEVQLPPGGDKTLIMPLDNSPIIGMWRLPQPLNTTATQIFSGETVDKPRVAWIMVKCPNATGAVNVVFRDMHPVTTPIPTTHYVDKYGQQADLPWTGKISADSQLSTALRMHLLSGKYPFAGDIYGGVSGTSTGTSNTGRWHVEKQNLVWYIIDPVGNRFFSAGVVGAGASPPAIVTGEEDRYATGALPAQSDPLGVHYSTQTDPITGAQVLTYNFYEANIDRRVGPSWPVVMVDSTVTRMRTWGFNTVGPSSNFEFAKQTTPLAFTDIVQVAGSYRQINDISTNWKMPDVYDPTWAVALEANLAVRTTYLQGNAMNMGMFVDNELPWAKPFSSVNARYGFGEDLLTSPSTQPAKIAFVNWLQQRYSNNIGALNTAWQSSFSSFAAILAGSTMLPATVPTAMGADLDAFTLVFARIYYSTVRQKLTALGYQGLYLGSRLLYFTPQVLQACRENCDVVSFNDYEATPTHYHDDIKALDAPLLISEVGFGACDLGRRPTGQNLLTETDRNWAYNQYVADALTWNNLVGLHWYKWQDDVVSGRFYDQDNCSQGLVSITDIPYWQTVGAQTISNKAFHARLLNNR